MNQPQYKRAGILRAAFQYQDLIAIDVLLRFYRDRTAFDWVKLEAEETDFRSVDDVVARRPDGKFEVIQVKFTPNPSSEKNLLDWEWLLAKSGDRTSLLEKWSATVLPLARSGKLGAASLRTDRIPAADFVKALNGKQVDFTQVDESHRKAIASQIGGEDNARAFFQAFDFCHSEPRLDLLKEDLRARLAFDVDETGWIKFQQSVEGWSILKNSPHPDGCIRYHHLMEALSDRRPAPMPQEFSVPPDYVVPNQAFDEQFMADTRSLDGVAVLWGPPGRGKSTYLSHCVQRMLSNGDVCIRHHYFLSFSDGSTGRFHYRDIEHSLTSQGKKHLPHITAEGLRDWIEAASKHLAAQSKRLVIIIDGLDHVWRGDRSSEHMAQVFANLFPLPPATTLVVGTQKIADEHLPKRLLQEAPKDQWLELPLLSEAAVATYVQLHDEAEELNVEVIPRSSRDEALSELATALHKISDGLPLHLVYSLQTLVRSGAPISPAGVAALPSCPGGDIRKYYEGLWVRLSHRSRDILHVLAGLSFPFPPIGIRDCFGIRDEDVSAYAQIDHLLDYQPVGVFPFHGSIFAFLRERRDHREVVESHARNVLDWLQGGAPTYWRWAWLWITEAEFGDANHLVSGPTRAWASDALARGYDPKQIERILAEAEARAFESFDLPRTLQLRTLKWRVSNAAQFQSGSWETFVETAVTMSKDGYPRAAWQTQLSAVPSALLPFVVKLAQAEDRASRAQEALDEIQRRQDRISSGEAHRQREASRMAIVRIVAYFSEIDFVRFHKYVEQFPDADSLAAAFAREALAIGLCDRVFEAAAFFNGPGFCRDLVYAAALEAKSLTAISGADARLLLPLPRCLALLKGEFVPPLEVRNDFSGLYQGNSYALGHDDQMRDKLHGLFFSNLAAQLEPDQTTAGLEPLSGEFNGWFLNVSNALQSLATTVASTWRSEAYLPTMAAVYDQLAEIDSSPSSSHDAFRLYSAFRLAVMDIAIDLHTLCIAVEPAVRITEADIATAASTPLWLPELWIPEFLRRRLKLHDQTAVAAVLKRVSERHAREITQFGERADICTQASQFAFENGCPELAASELRRASDCLLGYGWHKDLSALSILESISLLAKAGVEEADRLLLELAPLYHWITEYTDGDETGHTRSEYYATLADQMPIRGAACYGDLVRTDDWRYADELLRHQLTQLRGESPARKALERTLLQPGEIGGFTESRSGASESVSYVRKFLGRTTGRSDDRHARKYSDSASPKREREPFTVGSYPPERFGEFLETLSQLNDHAQERVLMRQWLLHWEREGKGSEALRSLRSAADQDLRRRLIDRTFDGAYEVAARVEGRSSAFSWLVLAHRHDYGWARWYSSETDAQERLDLVAKEYGDRWQDFIVQTSVPVSSDKDERGSFVLGQERLIYFLIRTGQVELATKCVRSMADVFKDEVSQQPLTVPVWAN